MKYLYIILLTFWINMAAAGQDIYPFTIPAQESRFNFLLDQFRCLVCQNETLGASNAPLAADLRQQIYTLVKSGKTNQQITDYLVQRYGDFVLYRPPLQRNTWLLWYAPFLLLLLALSGLFYLIWKRRSYI